MKHPICLDSIIINDQLALRPARPPRFDLEVEALHRLLRNLTITSPTNSQDLLDDVVKIALELCNADSAGVTLEETLPDGSTSLIRIAATGVLAHLCGSRTLRDHSPCGTALDRKTPQLFSHPGRYYPEVKAEWKLCEALHVPFAASTRVTGTLWVIAHSETRHFDREDLRMLQSLVAFAAAAVSKTRSDEERFAQGKNDSMSQLANRLAHEVNNPLQALTNLLHLIEPGASAEHLENGKLQLSRVTGLVQAILQIEKAQIVPVLTRTQVIVAPLH